MLPWIRKQPFAASYWGFSFGVSALCTAPLRMMERGDTGPAATLAPVLFILANVAVGLIAVGTMLKLLQGTLFAFAPAAAPVRAAPATP